MQDQKYALQFFVVGFFVCIALVMACSEDSSVDPHTHAASDINSGLLANARLNMGTGNGIDADMVDGLEASAFATTTHGHSGADITSGKIDNARLNTGSGNGLDADLLDGQEASAFAPSSHTHTLSSPILWIGGSSTLDTTVATYVTYPLDTATHDTSGGYFTVNANGTITINTPGYYRINTWSWVSSSAGGGNNMVAHIRKNTAIVARSRVSNGGTFTATQTMTYLGLCSAGDTLDVQYWMQLGPGFNYNWVSNGDSGVQIEYVGP
jgi:hypothetical protein